MFRWLVIWSRIGVMSLFMVNSTPRILITSSSYLIKKYHLDLLRARLSISDCLFARACDFAAPMDMP